MRFKKKSIAVDFSLTLHQKQEILRKTSIYYSETQSKLDFVFRGPSFLGSCALLPRPRSSFIKIRPPLLLNRRIIKFQHEFEQPQKRSIKKRRISREAKKPSQELSRGKTITLLNSVVPVFTPKLRPKSLSRELSKYIN